MEPKDEQLVKLIGRCAIRDQSALQALLEQVGPFLNGIAFRIVKSDDLSYDVVQEAFVQIWNKAGTYRPDIAKPLTWMASIVRYRAIDRLNREKRYQENVVTDSDGDIYENLEADDSPEQAIQSAENIGHVRECLGRLNERTRVCVELAYLEGYSREELAAKMKTNINTIKSWLHRGVDRLKQCLEAKQITKT